MEIGFLIIAFIFGTIIGSFINVLAIRGRWGRTISGRSMCMGCKKILHWYELIPIFSYLIQQGKCRGCAKKISSQYILVEFTTGLLFLFTILAPLSVVESIILLVVLPLLITMSITDIKEQILSDNFLYPTLIYGLAVAIYFSLIGDSFIPILAGVVLALPFALMSFVSRERAFGWGDSILALPLGWMLGNVYLAIVAFTVSFWVGVIVILVIYIYQKLKGVETIGRKTKIAFAPFLIVSFLLTYWFQDHIIEFLQTIYFL